MSLLTPRSSARSSQRAPLRRLTVVAALGAVFALAGAAQAPAAPAEDDVALGEGDPVGCGATPSHPGGDWPSYGADLANTRSQPLEEQIGPGNVDALAEVWRFDTTDHAGGVFNTTPIVADGCVYLAPSSGIVHALDADTGEIVWATQMQASPAGYGGAVVGAPAVAGDVLVVVINRAGSPYLAGLDRRDGAVRWETVIDDTESAITNASVTVYDGMAMVGFSGSSGGTPAERGGYVVVDAGTGELLAKTFTIPDEDFEAGYAGASIWSTAAVDPQTGYAYVGAGNPHSDRVEHERSNAILKVDLDRERSSFGQIVASYKGNPDHYVEQDLDQQPACQDLPPVYYFASFDATCGQLDLDFGASPNLFTTPDGALLVGALQKSGVYHAAQRDTMEPAWSTPNGSPCFACNASSSAFDGRRVLASSSPPGQLVAMETAAGGRDWVAPIGGGLHYFSVSHANGVVYTMDTYAFLNAFEAETGQLLTKIPTGFRYEGPVPGSVGANGSSGVAIARNTVYAAFQGHVAAYRLGDPTDGDGPGLPDPPDQAPASGTAVVAQPGSQFAGYTTPAMVVPSGGDLSFVNGDVASHDVVAQDAYGPDSAPWCGSFPASRCPLFWSPLIGLGGTTPVLGTEHLVPGETYTFTCTLHPNMQGSLVIPPEGERP